MSDTGRWCYRGPYGGRRYDWPQCRFCGRAVEPGRECPRVICPLCSSPQCSGRATCLVCHYGRLDGIWRPHSDGQCQRVRCENPAVAILRKREVCTEHAVSLRDKVDASVAHRDSGKGWEFWTFVE